MGEAVLRINGDDGMGFLVAHKAVEAGIKLAEKTGIAMVGCTHSTHYGMAALYVKQAVEAGYCCMVYTNSSPALPVCGGRTAFLGAAPFAVGMAGVDEILVPGEPEDRKTEESRKNGILLNGWIQCRGRCVWKVINIDGKENLIL